MDLFGHALDLSDHVLEGLGGFLVGGRLHLVVAVDLGGKVAVGGRIRLVVDVDLFGKVAGRGAQRLVGSLLLGIGFPHLPEKFENLGVDIRSGCGSGRRGCGCGGDLSGAGGGVGIVGGGQPVPLVVLHQSTSQGIVPVGQSVILRSTTETGEGGGPAYWVPLVRERVFGVALVLHPWDTEVGMDVECVAAVVGPDRLDVAGRARATSTPTVPDDARTGEEYFEGSATEEHLAGRRVDSAADVVAHRGVDL
mmetsp:Transcript_2389/g.5415  ORF Transcript_2389/g.5415 Transcript_2389/m.5415 type:complete len:251 (+) Transcript_2389:1666-2418(+)